MWLNRLLFLAIIAKGRHIPPQSVHFPLALSCSRPGVSDVTTRTGDQAEREYQNQTGN